MLPSKSKIALVAILSYTLLSYLAAGASIDDAKAKFLEGRDRKDGDELLSFSLDFDNDGKPELFMSLTHNDNAKDGQMFEIYSLVGEAYRSSSQIVSIPLETWFFGRVEELNSTCILKLRPFKGNPQLVTYSFTSGKIIETVIPYREDLYNRYLKTPSHPAISCSSLPPVF